MRKKRNRVKILIQQVYDFVFALLYILLMLPFILMFIILIVFCKLFAPNSAILNQDFE